MTQLYVSRLLLHRPLSDEHDPLLLCLTEETAPEWHPDQHTLLKATLASVRARRWEMILHVSDNALELFSI